MGTCELSFHVDGQPPVDDTAGKVVYYWEMIGMAMKNTVGLMLVAALVCAGCPAWAASITLTSPSGDLTLAQALADAGATVADLTGKGGRASFPSPLSPRRLHPRGTGHAECEILAA